MTGSDDDHSSTRPISVAELLARNGTIGAPPAGGRRRRRRGNADAVTVAELTGEIPIVRPDDPPPAPAAPAAEPATEARPEAGSETETGIEAPDAAGTPAPTTETAPADHSAPDEEIDEAPAEDRQGRDSAEPQTSAQAEPPQGADAEAEDAEAEDAEIEDTGLDHTRAESDLEDDEYADAVAEYVAHVEQRDAEPVRRFGLGRFGRKGSSVDAEQWTPDPVDEDGGAVDTVEDVADAPEIEDLDDEAALAVDADVPAPELDAEDADDELPSYLRSTEEPLFGGQTVADDLARRGRRSTPQDTAVDEADLDEDEDYLDDDEPGEPRRMSSFVHGVWIVGQSIIAVVFGAGLFVAFDQLWKWNNIVALVLSVLVILGLVVGVRVVRKTEDIGSTLIAVAVGALVTLGPLALLQSG